MPEAVTSFGAVAHEGWLYVFGGHKGERHAYSVATVSGAFHRLRLASDESWEMLPSVEPAQGVALAAHGSHVYRPGGMAPHNAPGEPGNLHSQASVHRYDLGRQAWEAVVPLPDPRSSHDTVVLGDTLYVGGGWTLRGAANQGEWRDTLLALKLRVATPRWESVKQPFRRRALAMAALEHRLYFLGGIDGAGDTLRAVDIFDTRSGSWTHGPDLPAGPMNGFGGSAVAQNGRIYFSALSGDLYELHPDASAWNVAATLRHPRFFHRLLPVGPTQLIAIGGEGGEGKRRDLELLTPAPKFGGLAGSQGS